MENSSSAPTNKSWLDRPIIPIFPKIKLEHLLVTIIIIVAVISRFYEVGLRVMSHDEVNHVVPSYSLYQGKGYVHDPVTHGPMQFHLLATSYFLFGDSDTSSRIPSALFSIATIIFVLFAYRRYLGRTGALFSGLFFLISPFMLFYGRYTRNESFIGLFSVIMLYAVLHYLEKGKTSTLYLYTVALGLYFCTKETSFIFTAEMLIFLAFVFLRDISKKEWKIAANRDLFILFMMIALVFLGVALGVGVITAKAATAAAAGTTAPLNATGTASAVAATNGLSVTHLITLISIGLAGIAMIIGIVLLITGMGWSALKKIRSFDLLLLTLTLVLPQLIALPISIIGWNPLDYSQMGLIRSSIILLIFVAMAVAIGMLWKPLLWLKNASIFYVLFTVLYTTFFTNGNGFFTGIVGSLGYWLSQQGVNRGTQPWYYYIFLQIPMYEYLAAFGTITAFILAIRHKLFSSIPQMAPAEQVSMEQELQRAMELEDATPSKKGTPVSPELAAEPVNRQADLPPVEDENPQKVPVLALLLYWSIMSLIAFSVAGEKMPWLTVHIALPMELAAGFSVGYLVDTLIKQKWSHKYLFSLLLLPIFLIGFAKVVGTLFGPNKPFAGMELAQLQTTSTFIFSLIAAILSGWGIFKLTEGWQSHNLFKTLVVTCFGIMAILTARSAFQANYINYDTGKEFLVYAHGASGPKDILAQVEDISQKTTGGKDVKVAYIGDALYPYWWYFRDYPNTTWIKDKLTHDLKQYPLVITDDVYLEKTRAILGDGYYEFKYKRLVWPMQDYMNQSIKSVWNTIKDPKMREAIFDIWMNKDYTLYSQIKGINTLTVENWEPSGNIYLFIDKNIVSSIWTYGTVPSAANAAAVDPYADKLTQLTPDLYFGAPGTGDAQFSNPHGIAIAKNGNVYVTDAKNNRIEEFSPDGKFIRAWGTYGVSTDKQTAPAGSFSEPWGIAVGPDGSVYVTDTWNYRVQKFTADGQFITMWGKAGTADSPTTFWGPRGIVVNQKGQVFVTDTGNNRVVIFDADGNYLGQFGVNGSDPGQFDEPVGLAVDNQNNIYVADTWNQRIQVFAAANGGLDYQPVRQWDVAGWKDQSVTDKPFIAVDASGNVFVTDPDGYRVLEFDANGNFIRGWGSYSSGIDGFGMPIGIAVDNEGKVWVSDSDNNYVLRFVMPSDTPVTSLLPKGLPGLPASSSQLSYNTTTGLVEGPFHQPVYRINSDGTEWIPIVPEGISVLVPAGDQPVKDQTGDWLLLNADGSTAFQWQPDLLLWIAKTSINAQPTSTK